MVSLWFPYGTSREEHWRAQAIHQYHSAFVPCNTGRWVTNARLLNSEAQHSFELGLDLHCLSSTFARVPRETAHYRCPLSALTDSLGWRRGWTERQHSILICGRVRSEVLLSPRRGKWHTTHRKDNLDHMIRLRMRTHQLPCPSTACRCLTPAFPFPNLYLSLAFSLPRFLS